ncbi:MAG TPA: PKD domain-containing protein [Chitinophagales bacterium]|nr:PKD domain-containing protein [Chitinophagales bacterium]
MKKIISSSAILLLLLISNCGYAQCMYPVSLLERVQQSQIIIEGKVISASSFWNDSQSMIYTASEIEVYKFFKGEFASERISVITEGGQVDNDMVVAEPGIRLYNGQAGIFFMHHSNYNVSRATGSTVNYELYAANQGFIRYDLTDKTAHDPFGSYDDLETELYNPILSVAGNPSFIEIKEVDFFQPGNNSRSLLPPTISSFSPTSTYAGTLSANLFTITGTNFGFSYVPGTSKLEFKNANDGGSTYITAPDNHIQSWTSTTITAWIPTGACKGQIRVTNNIPESAVSSSSVTILYNETNVNSGGTYYLPDLVNDNGSGGYTFVYNTTFNSNTAAVGAFERALGTWRCGTFVNFTKSGTTSIAVNASDGTNVITFDGSSPLSSGVLGTAYSYYTSCAAGVWYLSETDLKLRTNGTGGITWNYGPGATTSGFTDLESVVLHELGHAHQLGHTSLSPVTVMHYSIGSGTDRRTLTSASEVDGGDDVMSRSIISNSCGPSHITALTAGTCAFAAAPIADFVASSTSVCKNKTLDFTDLSTNSPTSWSWTFDGATPSTSTLQNPTGIKYTTVGSHAVTLTATNAIGSDAETKSGYITVNALPTVTVSSAPCSSAVVVLTATATPGTGIKYKWKKDGAAISGATKKTYSATASGTYKCTVTISATGCAKTSSGIAVTISCKMNDADASPAVNVYPNPSAGFFVFGTSAFDSDGEVEIYDITGRRIESHHFSSSDVIAGQNLANGIYMAEIRVSGKLKKGIKLVKDQ